MMKDAEIDQIYDAVDQLMRDSQFEYLDMFIRHWRLDDIDYTLAILVASRPAGSRLPSRAKLLADSIKMYHDVYDSDLFKGL